jgi:hypothetical protein
VDPETKVFRFTVKRGTLNCLPADCVENESVRSRVKQIHSEERVLVHLTVSPSSDSHLSLSSPKTKGSLPLLSILLLVSELSLPSTMVPWWYTVLLPQRR